MDFDLFKDHLGVSPVVGVILMVAITVVLAVTIGFVVLDLGDSTSQNARAGVNMEETPNGVQVTVDSFGGNTNQVQVLVNGEPVDNTTLDSVGSSVVVTAPESATVSVRGTTESGESSIVQNLETSSNTLGDSGEPTAIQTPGSGSESGGDSLNIVDVDECQAPASGNYSSVIASMSGDGTSGNPYVITNVHQLQAVNQNSTTLGAHYTLGQDINASCTNEWNSGNGFNPIKTFDGSIDGQRHSVQGLTINRSSESSVGLIGAMSGSSVLSNISVINADITGGDWRVGGLVGENAGGSVRKSYVTGNVDGGWNTGGLIGYNNGGAVEQSYSAANVNGGYQVAGLVGHNDGSITKSYATGSATGGSQVGGLVGQSAGSVTKSYATGTVTGSGSNVGGLVGQNYGSVSDSYWDTESTGQSSSAAAGSGSTGLTTADMTGTDALSSGNMSSLNSSNWNTVTGDYPILSWQNSE